MQPGAAATVGAPEVVRTPLLGRVRQLFLVLAWLLLLAEVVELVDAGTPLWPHRTAAAVAVATAIGLTLAVRATDRALVWADVAAVACVVAVGWGLGRVGAVLVMLLGLGLLRTLYGSRRSVALAVTGLLVGYGAVGVLLDGPGTLLDLGYVVVAVGLGGFAWVIRQVAEAVARHDVGASWDRVLAAAAHDLLQAPTTEHIDACLERVVFDLQHAARDAARGLLVVPAVTELDPAQEATPAGELAADLRGRLRWLGTDAQLARSLLASEERYRQLAEGNRDGIYLRSATNATAFHYVNEAGRAMLGDVDRPGAPGIDLTVVHPDDRAPLVQQLQASPYVRNPVRVRLQVRGAPDEVRWIELVEAPATVVDGRVRTVQGTVRDVTAVQRQEEAMASALQREHEAAERLRAIDELRATFLSAVSHELRTPLAGLVGAAQTLAARDRQLSAQRARQLAAVVERQSARLVTLLDDLTDVERLSRGQVEVTRQPIALLDLARDVVASLEDGHGRVAVTGDDAVVAADPGHVERIVRNLVRNALKHTPGTSRIRVEVTSHPGGALLVVDDDGPGIPPGLGDSLFDPFVQGPAAGSSPSPGTGIGLSLVSRIAELHGGRAWVEESPSGGARFIVRLAGESPAEGVAGVDDPPDPRVTKGTTTPH